MKTLLFIHGSGSTKETWLPCFDALREKYDMVTIDLRGHGETPLGNADFSVEQMVSDISQFVQIKKIDKFILVAHSMSVKIAVPYAYCHPEQVQALVLEDMHLIPRPKQEMSVEKFERLKKFKIDHSTIEEALQELLDYGYT